MKSNFPKMPKLIGAASVAFCLSAFTLPTAVNAGIIFYQGFDYGDLSGNFSTIATGWSAPGSSTQDAIYNNTSLTYPGITSTGGSVQTNGTWGNNQTVLTQALNIDISDKSEIWVSTLFSIDTATPANNRFATIGLGVVQDPWADAVVRRVGKGANQNAGYTMGTTALNDGSFAEVGTSTIQIVYRLAKGSAAEFWINPGENTLPGSGQLIGSNIQNLTTLESLTINFQGLSMRIDEFVVADRFDDIYAVPEPTHIAMIGGAAALGLVLLRRKRKQQAA